jgi:hypothetical protein
MPVFRQIGNTLGSSTTSAILTSGLISRLPSDLCQR